MAVNQKAVKVLNKVFEAGFYDNGRYSFHAGHYGGRYYPDQRPAKEYQIEQGHFLSWWWYE